MEQPIKEPVKEDSNLQLIEKETYNLYNKLLKIRQKTNEMLCTIKNGIDSPVDLMSDNSERKCGENRFLEIQLKLREDCNNVLCDDINIILDKIYNMVR